MNNRQISNFWNKISIDDNDCWNWGGELDKKGYGRVYLNSKHYRVHRQSYKLFNGSLDNNLNMHHICENKKCCNPDHLMQITAESHGKINHSNTKRRGKGKKFIEKSYGGVSGKTKCLNGSCAANTDW